MSIFGVRLLLMGLAFRHEEQGQVAAVWPVGHGTAHSLLLTVISATRPFNNKFGPNVEPL